jgi:hypothetical protein
MGAAGKMELRDEVLTAIPSLGAALKVKVAAGGANALSVGQLIMHHGFTMYWGAYSTEMYLWNKEGKKLPVVVKNWVPFLSTYDDDDIVCPAEEIPKSRAPAAPAERVARAVAEGLLPAGTMPKVVSLGVRVEVEDYQPDLDVDVPEGGLSLKDKANTLRHLMCHKPYNAACPSCRASRVNRRPHRRRPVSTHLPFERFGESVTIDHTGPYDPSHQGTLREAFAVVIYDLYSGYIGAYPCLTKTGAETIQHVQHFSGHDAIYYVYSDDSGEIAFACNYLRIPHDSSEPGEPQTNGVAERQVQEIKVATAANLKQAGLPHTYWNYAMKHA